MHDPEAQTQERVAWSEVGNMPTNDPEKAACIMAWTDLNAGMLKEQAGIAACGRQAEAGAVYHYSLSWPHEEAPDQAHQYAQVVETLAQLGLSEHQHVAVGHNDTDHTHVHVVVNLTHPDTGKRDSIKFDQCNLQAWALEYEREHGIHCHQREINAHARELGEPVKYRDQKLDHSHEITQAYHAADNGQSFANALEEQGLTLATARRGNSFVIVDEQGDVQKLARQLELDETGKAKTAAINAKLADLDRDSLPDGDQVMKEKREAMKARELKEPALPEAQTQEQAQQRTVHDIMADAYEQIPQEIPQEPPSVPPPEPPEVVIEHDAPDKGIQAHMLAVKQWMQDKLVSAYEYIKQRTIEQQQNQEQDIER